MTVTLRRYIHNMLSFFPALAFLCLIVSLVPRCKLLVLPASASHTNLSLPCEGGPVVQHTQVFRFTRAHASQTVQQCFGPFSRPQLHHSSNTHQEPPAGEGARVTVRQTQTLPPVGAYWIIHMQVLSLSESASRCLVTTASSLCSRYPRPMCHALIGPVIEEANIGEHCDWQMSGILRQVHINSTDATFCFILYPDFSRCTLCCFQAVQRLSC